MSTTVILVLGGASILVAYGFLILVPTWRSYGRIWERLVASTLTLFLLGTLVIVGAALGVAILWGSNTLI